MITPFFIWMLTVAGIAVVALIHCFLWARKKHLLHFASEREEFFVPGDNLHDDDDDDDD